MEWVNKIMVVLSGGLATWILLQYVLPIVIKRKGNMNKSSTGFFLVLSILSLVGFGAIRIYKSVVFDINVTGHLGRAANANTIELAQSELSEAILYLKNNHLTEGYTSIFWRDPSEDIGWWYGNLTASLHELESVPEETSQLEKTNVLMKLRETLEDHGEHGKSVVVCPEGISIYPANVAYLTWCSLSVLLTCLFGFFYFFSD